MREGNVFGYGYDRNVGKILKSEWDCDIISFENAMEAVFYCKKYQTDAFRNESFRNAIYRN